MLFENSRWRKLSKLVPHHILRHENGIKDLTVMNEERMTNEVRRDGRAPRPSLDWLLDGRRVHLFDFLEKMIVDKRSFFEGTTHKLYELVTLSSSISGARQ